MTGNGYRLVLQLVVSTLRRAMDKALYGSTLKSTYSSGHRTTG